MSDTKLYTFQVAPVKKEGKPIKKDRTPVNLHHVFYYKKHGKYHEDLKDSINKRAAVRHLATSYVVKGIIFV